MKKHRQQILLLLLFFLAALVGYGLFSPRPIVAQPEQTQIFWIQVKAPDGDPLAVVEDYPEEEILAYLSTCQERRTLRSHRNDRLDDVVIKIALFLDDDTKYIVLGETSYTNKGYRSTLFSILNGDQVCQDLLRLLEASS